MTTIRTAAQAAEVARKTATNDEGMCQQVTRGYYLAPSAGDRDGDGDADAYDGWLSEPVSARMPGDRKPPLGFPVSFKSNDGKGHGHRAISFGDANHDGVYLIRSTDFDTTTKRYKAEVVGTGTIAEVERAMGVTYLGWSKTIDGVPIVGVLEAAKEAPEIAKARQLAQEVQNEVNDPARHRVDLDKLNRLIDYGVQPFAAAAKAYRNAIQVAAAAFNKEVD